MSSEPRLADFRPYKGAVERKQLVIVEPAHACQVAHALFAKDVNKTRGRIKIGTRLEENKTKQENVRVNEGPLVLARATARVPLGELESSDKLRFRVVDTLFGRLGAQTYCGQLPQTLPDI